MTATKVESSITAGLFVFAHAAIAASSTQRCTLVPICMARER
jgi:hypothetical protein